MPDTINKIVLPDNSEHVLEDGTIKPGYGIEIATVNSTGDRIVSLSLDLSKFVFESDVAIETETEISEVSSSFSIPNFTSEARGV